MNKQAKKNLFQAFLNAVNTWKQYVLQLKKANKLNKSGLKSIYGKAVFYWRKEAERLKKLVDNVILVC